MFTWALIAVLAQGASPELIGTYEEESQCRTSAIQLDSEMQRAKGFLALSACFKITKENVTLS